MGRSACTSKSAVQIKNSNHAEPGAKPHLIARQISASFDFGNRQDEDFGEVSFGANKLRNVRTLKNQKFSTVASPKSKAPRYQIIKSEI